MLFPSPVFPRRRFFQPHLTSSPTHPLPTTTLRPPINRHDICRIVAVTVAVTCSSSLSLHSSWYHLRCVASFPRPSSARALLPLPRAPSSGPAPPSQLPRDCFRLVQVWRFPRCCPESVFFPCCLPSFFPPALLPSPRFFLSSATLPVILVIQSSHCTLATKLSTTIFYSFSAYTLKPLILLFFWILLFWVF